MVDYEHHAGTDHNGFLASTYYKPSDRSVFIPLSTRLLGSSALRSPVEAFKETLVAAVRQLSDMAPRLSPVGYHEAMQQPNIFQPVGIAAKELRREAIQRKSELQAIRNDWATPKFVEKATDPDPRAPFRRELRDRLALMKPTQSIELAMRDYDVAAAIMEGGPALAFANGWTPDMWPRFESDFVERNLTRRYEAQQPNRVRLSDLLDSSTDTDAAQREAADCIAAHKRYEAEVDEVRAVLANTVDFVALNMDSDRERALNVLMPA